MPLFAKHSLVEKVLAVAVAAATVLALAVAASARETGSAEHASKQFTIGYSALALSAPPFQQALHALEAQGKNYNFKVVAADARQNALTQLQQLQTWLNTHRVQAIDVVPVDINALVPALRQAAKQHVPVIVSPFPKSYRSPLMASVTFSWLAYGKNAGKGAVDCIKSRLGGQANVAIVEPTIFPGLISDRIKGVKEEISKLPGVKVVAEVGPNKDQAAALANVATALRAHPEINTLIAVDSDDGLGALRAVQQAGMNPKQLCIQSSDYVPEAAKEVVNGNIWGDVQLPFEKSGPIVAKVLSSLLRNPHSLYRGKTVYVPTRLIETPAK
jgi:ABC-type sugar transport system substrate-binding protein